MTDQAQDKTSDDWSALKVRCVVKGDFFKFTLWLPVDGSQRSFTYSQSGLVENELLLKCADQVRALAPQGCTIVPVPNSHAVALGQDFKTFEHARHIALQLGPGYEALPLILWREAKEKAHKGGKSRSFREHLANMHLSGETLKPVVLYDDVVTTGSQLAASQDLLSAAGMSIAGMVAVVSVLSADGTHSDLGAWKSEIRLCY